MIFFFFFFSALLNYFNLLSTRSVLFSLFIFTIYILYFSFYTCRILFIYVRARDCFGHFYRLGSSWSFFSLNTQHIEIISLSRIFIIEKFIRMDKNMKWMFQRQKPTKTTTKTNFIWCFFFIGMYYRLYSDWNKQQTAILPIF